MYRKEEVVTTSLEVNTSVEGEPIEYKVERIMNNEEPISDGAPQIFTERKDGVIPDFNIRTDKWEYAIDAMDKVQKSKIAKREKAIMTREEALESLKTKKEDGGTESTVAPEN